MKVNIIYKKDVKLGLSELPDDSIHCCVTSPPYWGLRDYGTAKWLGGDENCKHKVGRSIRGGLSDLQKENKGGFGDEAIKCGELCPHCGAKRIDEQIGLEKTPEEYIEKIVEVFREVKRVLRYDGTLWLNLGDSYAGNNSRASDNGRSGYGKEREGVYSKTGEGLKTKDLVGIPWMVAFALRADGWYLRQDIIWSKPAPMPESVSDRCTKAHEYIFLLAKSKKYYYDADAIKTEMKDVSIARAKRGVSETHKWIEGSPGSTAQSISQPRENINIYPDGKYHDADRIIGDGKANKKSVWTINSKGYKEAHFATFPEELVIDPIKAGCPEFVCSKCGNPYVTVITKELIPTSKAAKQNIVDKRDKNADKNDQGSNRQKDGHIPGMAYKTTEINYKPTCTCNAKVSNGIVLDPFMGSGTTGVVARKLNRNYVGFEINKEYIDIANKRLYKELGMYL